MVGARGAACIALLFVLLAAGPAAAQQRSPGNSGGLPTNLPGTAVSPNALTRPTRDDVPPPGRGLTAQRVGAIAGRSPTSPTRSRERRARRSRRC